MSDPSFVTMSSAITFGPSPGETHEPVSDRESVLVHVGIFRNMPDKLAEFLRWGAGLLEDVPEEFHEAVTFDIDFGEREIDVSYSRPETDDEMLRRLNEEKERHIHDEWHREMDERSQYARLRKKYGEL